MGKPPEMGEAGCLEKGVEHMLAMKGVEAISEVDGEEGVV